MTKEKKPKYTIGGIDFTSKKATLDHVRNIAAQYRDREPLSDVHLAFMVDLLKHHEYAAQKIGVGIAKMWVQKSEQFPTRGFWLERIDGSQSDFSFINCLSPVSPLSDFKAACRRTVAPFVTDFRQKWFLRNGPEGVCPVNGSRITLHHSHVDHEAPHTFDAILSAFIEQNAIQPASVRLKAHGDGDQGSVLDDAELESKWHSFHNERARLRVISPAANLSLPK